MSDDHPDDQFTRFCANPSSRCWDTVLFWTSKTFVPAGGARGKVRRSTMSIESILQWRSNSFSDISIYTKVGDCLTKLCHPWSHGASVVKNLFNTIIPQKNEYKNYAGWTFSSLCSHAMNFKLKCLVFHILASLYTSNLLTFLTLQLWQK